MFVMMLLGEEAGRWLMRRGSMMMKKLGEPFEMVV